MTLDIIELMPNDTQDFMAPAWVSCLSWAIGKREIREAYREDTGDSYIAPSAPLDRMIDEATGRTETFVRDFTAWFNIAVWGNMDGGDDSALEAAGKGAGDDTSSDSISKK